MNGNRLKIWMNFWRTIYADRCRSTSPRFTMNENASTFSVRILLPPKRNNVSFSCSTFCFYITDKFEGRLKMRRYILFGRVVDFNDEIGEIGGEKRRASASSHIDDVRHVVTLQLVLFLSRKAISNVEIARNLVHNAAVTTGMHSLD